VTQAAGLQLAARRKALRQAFVPGWALFACLLVLAQAPAELRAPVVIVFFCFVPGTALVGLFNPDSFGVELSLSVALSVAISGFAAGILVYAHLWSSTAVVVIVTVISLAGGLRDIRLGRRERYGASRLVGLVRMLRAGRWRVVPRGLPAAVVQIAELAGRAAGSVSGGVAAVPRLATRRSDQEATPAPAVAASPLQRFLLDELRRRTGSPAHGARRRRSPRSLANLEPHELADLLSWSSLQRFVTQRVIREVSPELWFVDDLERRLRTRALVPRDEPPGRAAPRGVVITGVSARTTIPVAWRLLEQDGKKEWRTRLALEMIDALPEPGLAGAVVAADTAYGSLAGFRGGLEARGLSYLFRVDPITAARELAPHESSRSAAEAREILREWFAAPAAAESNAAGGEPELVLAHSTEQLLLCELATRGRDSVFWLSNLPAETAPERLASLVRLANRSRAERATADLLQGALTIAADGEAGLDRELVLLALAQGLQRRDVSAAEGVVEG
jgi:DDE superfamily endonuclease